MTAGARNRTSVLGPLFVSVYPKRLAVAKYEATESVMTTVATLLRGLCVRRRHVRALFSPLPPDIGNQGHQNDDEQTESDRHQIRLQSVKRFVKGTRGLLRVQATVAIGRRCRRDSKFGQKRTPTVRCRERLLTQLRSAGAESPTVRLRVHRATGHASRFWLPLPLPRIRPRLCGHVSRVHAPRRTRGRSTRSRASRHRWAESSGDTQAESRDSH